MNLKYSSNDEKSSILPSLIQKVKNDGRSKEYDSIIGLSGGRDSTYCLYLLKEWGLNPLAVHFDNNMDSKIAVQNIKNACRKLDVDLHTFVVDWEEYKDLQMAFFKASIPAIDAPLDHAIISTLFQYAYDNKISYIISGGYFRGEGPIPREWSCIDADFIRDVYKKHGKLSLKKYPIRSFFQQLQYRLNGLTTIHPLNYLNFAYRDAMQLMERELNWQWYGGHHFESIFTRWAFGYYLPTKFGIDKRGTDFSALIRSGQMTKDEAMAKMNDVFYSADQEKDDRRYIMNKLEISDSMMDDILSAPPRKNSDYAHSSQYIRIIRNLIGPKQI